MDVNLLEKAGLTKNEIRVFLKLLEMNESTSGPLIKSTGINSSKVYESLEKLERKGLASYVKKGNKKYFQAADATRLMDYIDEKKRQLDEEKSEIKKMLPELNALRKKSKEEQQEATIYQGFRGYKTLLENMLNELSPNGTYLAFASGMLKEALGAYWFIFQKKKKQFNIRSRCIWDSKIKKQKDYLEEYYGTGRFIEKGTYLSPADVFVYNDKVIQVSYTTKPIFALLIRSKGLAQSYKELFETIWKNIPS